LNYLKEFLLVDGYKQENETKEEWFDASKMSFAAIDKATEA